ncbi:MAG: agmatinase [Patescibacteria group bacterium]|nr:agmatinase [Patescibacteria group bacterium]
MTKSILNAKKVDNADAVIVSAAYEKTASSRKGTINGPKAILNCLDTKLEFFDRKYKCEANKYIKIAQKDLGNISKLSPEKALAKITSESEKLVKNGQFVLLLGGEHSVSLGLFQALAKHNNPKDVTIVQIDAHCDLRDTDGDYSSNPSKYAHSCVLHRGNELGYKLVQVGIRTYSVDEYNYFSNPKNNITVFEWGLPAQVGNGNKIPKIEDILKSITTKNVYLTIDVDGFDPAYMPGTGTPVQGGLEWWYGMELIEKLITKKNLIGADIVEVSPMRDSVLTEYGAAQLAYTIITNKFRDKLK